MTNVVSIADAPGASEALRDRMEYFTLSPIFLGKIKSVARRNKVDHVHFDDIGPGWYFGLDLWVIRLDTHSNIEQSHTKLSKLRRCNVQLVGVKNGKLATVYVSSLHRLSYAMLKKAVEKAESKGICVELGEALHVLPCLRRSS